MKEVKVGLIGLGFMGTTHFRIYKELPNVRIAAVADVDPVKLTGDISKVIGNIGDFDNSIPFDMTGIEVYTDALEMIKNADVDMIDICVPTPKHMDYILAGFAAGKHVFCEKPLCRTYEQIKTIRDAVAATDRFFNVGMCLRQDPPYRHTYELLQSGKLGKVKSASLKRFSPSVDGNAWENWFMKEEMSGGAILDMHLHDTDAIRYFFGKPESVISTGGKGMVSDKGIDHVNTTYFYSDGKYVTAEGGWEFSKSIPFYFDYKIVCEKATIKCVLDDYTICWNDGTIETPELELGNLPTGWHRELAYFTDCVRDNVKPDKYQTPESIFDAVAVIMAEIESVESRKEVEVKYV